MSRPCFCPYNRTMDMATPRNVKLTAFYRRSFAFRTIRDRLPIILTQTVDRLTRFRDVIAEQYGPEAREDIKRIMSKIVQLKYEIQTNKPLKYINSSAPDAKIYNDYILQRDGQEGEPRPYHSIWLLVECYMYRKIKEFLEQSKVLKDFDIFRFNKEESYVSSEKQISELASTYSLMAQSSSLEEFAKIIKLNLWGNKCDLSLSLGEQSAKNYTDIGALDCNILVDDIEDIWKTIKSTSGSDRVDIVLDNAGYEVFADMCLADYIIKKNFAQKVVFHVKTMPWFISDVMAADIEWLIDQLHIYYEAPNVTKLAGDFSKNFETKKWEVRANSFWTYPLDFTYMPMYDPDLYEELSKSKLIIFKGDLNYRKLFGETNWDPTTPVKTAIGNFGPSKLCILRTLKADIICGLEPGLAEECEKVDPKWMETGEFAVIQFSDKVIPLADIEMKIKQMGDSPALPKLDFNCGGEGTESVVASECECKE